MNSLNEIAQKRQKYHYNRLTLGGVVLAANSKLVAFPAGLYCGESLKSAGELAAEPPVPPLLSTEMQWCVCIHVSIL